MLDYIHRLTP